MATVARVSVLDSLRMSLPTQAYLSILSQIALTGTMPVLDMQGKPTTEAMPCTPQMRYDALKYLTDKNVPQAKAQDANPPPDLEAVAAKSHILKSMSIADLIAMRDAARARLAAPAAS